MRPLHPQPVYGINDIMCDSRPNPTQNKSCQFALLFHQVSESFIDRQNRGSHWDLMLQSEYLLKTWALDENPFENPGVSAHPDNFNAWKNPGDITNFPLLLASNNDHASRSSRFLYKNDYIRLKSLIYNY